MMTHPEIARIIGVDSIPDEPDSFYGTCPCCKSNLTRFNSGDFVAVFCKSGSENCKLSIAVKNHNNQGIIKDKLCRLDIRLHIMDDLDVVFDFDQNLILIGAIYNVSLLRLKRVPIDFFDAESLITKIKLWMTFS